MEEQEQSSSQVQIRGRDLPGAVNVLPMGLSEVLAKRESREINIEQSSNSTTYSTGTKSGSKVEQTFSSAKSFSSSFASSSSSASSGVSTQKVLGTSQALSSSTAQQQSLFQQQQQQQLQHQQQLEQQRLYQEKLLQEQQHGAEIKQESLKSTLQSAITDIEEQIDGADYEADKENLYPVHQKVEVESSKYHQNGVMSNPTGEVTEDGVSKRFRLPHEFKGRPGSTPEVHYDPSEPLNLPEVGSGSKRLQGADESTMSMTQSSHEEYSHQQTSSSEQHYQTNGVSHEESSSSSRLDQHLTSGGGGSLLDKVMTPSADYDSSSLKRRNPRQMFTDSAFYSPKFHPSVADQVEMAHRLSSSLYEDGNKMSKGQEMYLKRMKKSGVDISEFEEPPHHDKVPNLKLVMNPEGKLHDWTDVPEDELPELQQIAVGGPSAEIAHNLVENLQACKGRGGELFAKRRKKADKWVVDESSLGSTAPSQFADHFLQQQSFQQQQFQMQQQQEYQEQMSRQNEEQEHERIERQQFQEEQQMIFRQQQLQKQQQSMEIRQMRQQQEVDLPPDFKPYSLKGRSFTPTFDTSIHNVQGINVWANKAPKPFGKSSTLPRTATPSHAKSTYAEMPEVSLRSEYEQQVEQQHVQQHLQQKPLEVPQVAICPATPQVTEEDLQRIETSKTSVQQMSSSSSSTSSTTIIKNGEVSQRELDLEDQKRREYEAWFKSQEREQQLLEYDCSVKYVEKQVDQHVQHQEVTQITRQEQHFQQMSSSSSTNIISSKGVTIGATIPEEPLDYKHDQMKPPVVATPEPIPEPSIQQQQQLLLKQEQERILKQKQQEHELLLKQQEQERLLRQQEEQRLLQQQQQEQERLLRLQQEQQLLKQQEEQRLLQQQQQQQELLRQQQEQERLLRQQHEQEQLLRQQQEQEHIRRQQLEQQEQERILRQQQEQLLRQQQQEQLLRQQQEQEQLQRKQQQEQLLRQQQQQEQLLRQQQEQMVFQQQQQQQQQQQMSYRQEQSYQSHETHTRHQQMTELHHSELSMQMKTGGLVYRQEQKEVDIEDYVGSLRPTTTGSIIRTEGEALYTHAPSHEEFEGHFPEVELRKTSTGGKKDLRQSGVFVGIFGENNALVNSSEAFDYEKHSVRDLVDHFSKTKPRAAPAQAVPQQVAQTPPLSFLREQAKGKQFHYQEKGKSAQETSYSSDKSSEESKLQEMMLRRRNSLKDYLLMEFSEGTSNASSAHQLLDPSTILKGGQPICADNTDSKPPPHFSLRSQSASPSTMMLKSNIKPPTPKPFGLPQEARPPQPRRLVKPEPLKPLKADHYVPPSPPPVLPKVHDLSKQCIHDEQAQHLTEQEHHYQQQQQHLETQQHQHQMQLLEQKRQLELQQQQQRQEHLKREQLQRQQEEQLRLEQEQELAQQRLQLEMQRQKEVELFERQEQERFLREQEVLYQQQLEQERKQQELQRQRQAELELQQKQHAEHERQQLLIKQQQQQQAEFERQQAEIERQQQLLIKQQQQQQAEIERQQLLQQQQRQAEYERQQVLIKQQQQEAEIERQQLLQQQQEQQRQAEYERQQLLIKQQQQQHAEFERQQLLQQQQQEQQRHAEYERQQILIKQQAEQKSQLLTVGHYQQEQTSSSDDDSVPHYTCEAKMVCRPYPSPLTVPTVMSPSLDYQQQFHEHFGHQSVEKRSTMLYTPGSRPSSKMSIEQMMEELNEPLPPMQPLPSDLITNFQQMSTFQSHSSASTSTAISHTHPLEWQPQALGSVPPQAGFKSSSMTSQSSKTYSAEHKISRQSGTASPVSS